MYNRMSLKSKLWLRDNILSLRIFFGQGKKCHLNFSGTEWWEKNSFHFLKQILSASLQSVLFRSHCHHLSPKYEKYFSKYFHDCCLKTLIKESNYWFLHTCKLVLFMLPLLPTFNHPSINQFYQVMVPLLIFTGRLLSGINGSQLYFYGQELVKHFY